MDFLESNDDPRNPSKKLIENTIVVFTSDNGAESKAKTATGPVRSNKGSAYEGGHRVPYIVSWPAGGVGDGDAKTPGQENSSRIGLIDTFATLSEITDADLPNLRKGEKGAEDSKSILAAWKGKQIEFTTPVFHNDHSEMKSDHAACALRVDNPMIDDAVVVGQWKLFFDANLVRFGTAKPTELYDLSKDLREDNNLIAEPELQNLVTHLSSVAERSRNSGGLRLDAIESGEAIEFSMQGDESIPFELCKIVGQGVNLKISAKDGQDKPSLVMFTPKGLGVLNRDRQRNRRTGQPDTSVNSAESVSIEFDRDVLIESVSIVAGDGSCGGFYQVGEASPLAIYCVDADNDAQDQRGSLSDLGVLLRGKKLKLSSKPHFAAEAAGQWRLQSLRIRIID
ncbi:MAG: sulfatase-like hydrolase/transferase [Planctomycetota bacterium]